MGQTTLSEAQLATHKHDLLTAAYPNGSETLLQGGPGVRGFDGRAIQTTGGSQPHDHDFTGSTISSSNLPPFYALALIMRIS